MKKDNKTPEQKPVEGNVDINILHIIRVRLGMINYKHIIVIVVVLAFVWAMFKS
jgi:hypothetical protein